jgi:hypothetical protein
VWGRENVSPFPLISPYLYPALLNLFPNKLCCHFHYEREKSWALVAHACNPSCSGGSDQKNFDSKPALGK